MDTTTQMLINLQVQVTVFSLPLNSAPILAQEVNLQATITQLLTK